MSFILMLSGVLEAYRHRAVPNRTDTKLLLERRGGRRVSRFHMGGPAYDDWWAAFSFLARDANHCVGTSRVSVTVTHVGTNGGQLTSLSSSILKSSSYRIVKRAPGHSKNTGVC
jgi:hypothetical protein